MATVRCVFAAEIQTKIKRPCEMHSHACTEVVYYLQGSGHLLQDGHKFNYQPGWISIYQPGIKHADEPESAGQQLCLGISGCNSEKLPSGMFKADKSVTQCVEYILREIKNPLEKDSQERLDILAGWLALELNRITGNIPRKDSLPVPVKAAKEIFDSRFEEMIDLQELAGSLYVSPDYFRHLFKKSLGESPLNYLIRRRLEFACELLNFTDLSVGEIAGKVGFDNVYYFSRIFRKRHGIPPSVYRSQSRQKDS